MYRTSPHLVAWKPILAAVCDIVGPESPIFRAACTAALGRDPDGEKFLVLVERLPAGGQDRWWESVKKYRARAGRVA